MVAATLLCLVFLAVLGRAVVAAVRDWQREGKLAEHIACIGADALTGVTERLVYPQFIGERRK